MKDNIKTEEVEEVIDNTEATENQEVTEDKSETTEKHFTQDDVNSIVEKRLAREREKLQKEVETARSEGLKEGERRANLSQEEKIEEERLAKERELEEARALIAHMELEKETTQKLEEEGIPLKFKNFLMGPDAESTAENITNFKEVYGDEVQAAIEKRLAGKTPKISQKPQEVDVWGKLSNKYKK